MTRNDRHQRLRELFEAVCDLSGPERDAYLASVPGTEKSLIDEVRSLLSFDDVDCDLGGGGDGFVQAAFPEAEDEEAMPEWIGEFRLLELLGSGGMGTVYKAEQKSPRRQVAVKIMRSGIVSRSMLARFRQEGQIQAQLKHPGIAQVFETGIYKDRGNDTPYFVMELVEGVPLTRYAKEHSLSVDEKLRLFLRVCEAIDHAHRKGVLHRDLKPENILVEVTREGPRPKVLDFGVAKLTGGDSQFTTLRTDVGQIIGTLSYMSPEQLDGDSSRLDARTDVHALGVILYELLAGARPFDIAGRPLPEAARIVREHEPSTIASVSRSFRGDIETIVRKAIEKDPSRRYDSAFGLAADLRRHLENEPIVARPPSTMYQLSKFAKRNRALVAGVAATILALVIGLVGTTWFAIESSARQRLAEWQSYRATLVAASSAFDSGQILAAERLVAEAPSRHRGWEWDLLNARLQAWTCVIGSGEIRRVATSRDGDQIVALLRDGALSVFDSSTGELVSSARPDRPLSTIANEHQDGVIAALDEQGGVLLIDAATGTTVNDRLFSSRGFKHVAVGDSGRRLIASDGQTVRVWSVGTGSVIATLGPTDGAASQIRSVHASRSGRHVGVIWRKSTSNGISVCTLWDLESGESRVVRSPERARTVAFRDDEEIVAFGMVIRNVHLHALDEQQDPVVLGGHLGAVSGLAFLDDAKLVSVSGREIRVRDPGQTTTDLTFLLPAGVGAEVLPLPLGRFVTFSEKEGLVWVWDQSETGRASLPHESYVYDVAWSTSGKKLASFEFQSGAVSVWDAESRNRVALLSGGFRGARVHLGFDSDDEHLLMSRSTKGDGSRVDAIDTESWTTAQENLSQSQIDSYMGGVDGLRLTRFDQHAPGGGSRIQKEPKGKSDGTGWVLTNSAGKRIAQGTEFRGGDVAWSPDGHWFVLAAQDVDGARVYNASDGREVAVLSHPSKVMSVDVHPGGQRLVTGAEDGTIRVFDTKYWDLVLEIEAHGSYVRSLRFSPDGNILASGSGDKTVRLWPAAP